MTITNLQPDCGCTTAGVKKRTIAPGEKGVLTAILDAKGLSGLQEKSIQVFLDDTPKPVTLKLRVTIPPWIEVVPRLLFWSIGENGKAKEAIVSVNREAKIKITSVKANNAAMTVSFEPSDEPGRFRLIAKPVSTTAPIQTMVTITMESPGSAQRSYVVFAHVL